MQGKRAAGQVRSVLRDDAGGTADRIPTVSFQVPGRPPCPHGPMALRMALHAWRDVWQYARLAGGDVRRRDGSMQNRGTGHGRHDGDMRRRDTGHAAP